MIDKQSLRRCLQSLIDEQDSKVSRTAIETMLKIHRNVLYNENEIPYRCINPENHAFNEKVWSILPARQFMKKCGWIPAHSKIFFNSDENLIDIIEILLEHRSVQPQEFEWVEETKIIAKSEEKKRDEELRRKAAIERDKELAQFQKDKKSREDLAKKIREEVKADNRRRKQLHGYFGASGNC